MKTEESKRSSSDRSGQKQKIKPRLCHFLQCRGFLLVFPNVNSSGSCGGTPQSARAVSTAPPVFPRTPAHRPPHRGGFATAQCRCSRILPQALLSPMPHADKLRTDVADRNRQVGILQCICHFSVLRFPLRIRKPGFRKVFCFHLTLFCLFFKCGFSAFLYPKDFLRFLVNKTVL